ATVTMDCDGTPVTVVQETISGGLGDNSLVWQPQGLATSAPDPDRTYTVTLDNVMVNGSPRSFTYNVVVMDPFNLGQTVDLSGPAEPYIGADNTYAFTPVPQATEYELRTGRAVSGAWTEGAEANPAPRVVDGTTGAYSLFTTAVKRSGNRAFHLTFEDFPDNDQTITIDRAIIPGPASVFQFYSRFRFATTTSHLTAEISTDDGNRWTGLATRSGNGAMSSGGWEANWIATSIPLADYAGQVVTLRLRYHYDPFTPVFLGTDDNTGVFVDDVTVTSARQLTDLALTPVAGGAESVKFNPPVMGEYFLAMQARVGGVWFGFGPALVVQANQTAPPAVQIAGISVADGIVQVEFTVTNPSSASFHLLSAPAPSGTYTADGSAVLETLEAGFRYRFTIAMGAASRYYRVSMD
ncbi:MAG TPA: hypothetical protein VLD18_12390, partial [Verrucomicrobiae bacterium]|nr:hypothetical protein [Verrucomicrobiae bacterium]